MRIPYLRSLAVLAATAATLCQAAPPELLWMSDVAPRRDKDSVKATVPVAAEKAMKLRDGMDSVIGGDEGGSSSGTKRLWLRQGDEPARAGYAEAAALSGGVTLLDGRGMRTQAAPSATGDMAQVRCELPEMGFYNAYFTRQSVQGDTLWVQSAKAELLNGTCCKKLPDIDPARMRGFGDPTRPLELVRAHQDDEKLFTRMVSGDRVAFTVLRMGQPLPGAQVTMLTQMGWQKRAVADADGRVEFTLIRDYFPDWKDFRRYTKETFVVVADVEVAEGGHLAGRTYEKVHYQATLSGKYAPSPYDYKSYAWGLGIAVFVAAFGGLGIYLYRRRRLKPFKEVRFDETA